MSQLLMSSPDFWNRINGLLFILIVLAFGWLLFESQQKYQSKTLMTYFAVADTTMQQGQIAFAQQCKQLEEQINRKAKTHTALSKYGKQCEEVCFLTHHFVEQLEILKQEVIDVSGGQLSDESLVAAENLAIVQAFIQVKKKALQFENEQIKTGLLAALKGSAEVPYIKNKLSDTAIDTLWTSEKFQDAPLQAMLMFLENTKATAQQLEYQLLHHINKQTVLQRLKYDQFLPAVSGRDKITLGERYKAEVYLVPYTQSDSMMTIKVDGQPLNVENGKASYTTKSNKKGATSYEIEIAIQEPMNDTATIYKKTFEYTVR